MPPRCLAVWRTPQKQISRYSFNNFVKCAFQVLVRLFCGEFCFLHGSVNPRLLKDHAMAVSRAIGPSDRKTNLAIVVAMHDCPSMFPMTSSSLFSNFSRSVSFRHDDIATEAKTRRFTRSSPSSSWLGVVVMVFGHHARSRALALRWCGARGADTMLQCQRLRTARVHVV